MKIVVNGTPFTDFTSAHVSKSVDNMAATFDFTATWDVGEPFPIPRAASVQILVDDQQVLDGYVERISPQISANSSDISISGRDRTSDLIDSTLPANAVQVVVGADFVSIIKRAIAAIGSNCGVINNVPDLTPFAADEIVACRAGQVCFEFLELLARKKQVLLTTDGYGNVVITRSGTERVNFAAINHVDGDQNTVLSSNAKVDDSQRFHRYAVVSQGNVAGLANSDIDFDSEDVAGVEGDAVIDADIRQGRTMYIVAEESSSKQYATDRAKWECNIRKAKSREYSCEVDGYSDDSGVVFLPNKLMPVDDTSVNVYETMLIKSVDYTFSVSDGETTSFNLVNQHAFTLESEEPVPEGRSKKKKRFDFGV